VAVSAVAAWRIARISLTTAAPEATARFYREALGFEEIGTERRAGDAFGRLMGLHGARARVVLLRLGRQEVELVAFDPPGRPYPAGSTSKDRWFQHMAIVVSDIHVAHARLSAHPGWTPISLAGPQRLPKSSGGVTAFKFRDPEGHPLELLEFPPERMPPIWQGLSGPEPCRGIDHSAIVVADTAASVSFYERLGFVVAARSLNQGAEQEGLDAVSGARVEVTALQQAAEVVPHLELLSYVSPPAVRSAPSALRSNDVAATRLVLDPVRGGEPDRASGVPGGGTGVAMLHDPDGHGLVLLG
jgi:catechol 2,3-dioxygenase-like lactoylglutathione lyase family enzyme